MHSNVARADMEPAAAAPLSGVDAAAFRGALGRFASGVTIVTTRLDERDFGSTVSAFSSVSLDPPLVLCCFRQQSDTARALSERNQFAVCLLADGQAAIARRFAATMEDRFEGMPLQRTEEGLPLIPGCLAYLLCRVDSRVQAGDHTVVFGSVDGVSLSDGSPLVVFRGAFGSFQSDHSR
jgi:flavin reductase (DIM6/NTAB) family NADH-FMN oxidoreductase RutF